MKNLFRYILPFVIFTLITTGCGSTNTSYVSDDDDYTPLMVLPAELTAVDANLSGRLYVYRTINNTTTLISAQTVIFEIDTSGNDIAVSPPLTLNQNTTYRFILVFSLSNVEIAHVDKTLKTSSEATTNLSYDASEMVTSNNSIEEILAQTNISADIAAGILPNLDLDDDGYSNLEELTYGSDPEDADSLPE